MSKSTAESGQRSLFGEILDWMLAPLLLIWPISVGLTWLVAQGIANKPYDRALGEMTSTLGLQVAAEALPGRSMKSRYALAPEAAALLRVSDARRPGRHHRISATIMVVSSVLPRESTA